MLPTIHLLEQTDFPDIQRDRLDSLQVNLGYLCNQSCVHCHVNAGPTRRELMSRETVELLLEVLRVKEIAELDITGGAPEMNPNFRYLVEQARELGVRVIDRCNLSILLEPGYDYLAGFLAEQQVTITASLPCYSENNVDAQRGKGVFSKSIEALQLLNKLGYGKGAGLQLNLVYNPVGPFLPPPQQQLKADYSEQLARDFGIVFDELFTITNMPISRFGSMLLSRNEFDSYMCLLRSNYSAANLGAVMCRNLISVDWQGYLYDCDFNQMLELPLHAQAPTGGAVQPKRHLRDLLHDDFVGQPIKVGEHCYGCTAGQGSSCGGALD